MYLYVFDNEQTDSFKLLQHTWKLRKTHFEWWLKEVVKKLVLSADKISCGVVNSLLCQGKPNFWEN